MKEDEAPPLLTAVILAAGRSTRMGAKNKLLLDVGDVPVVARAIRAFASLPAVETLVVTGAERARVAALASQRCGVRVVHNPDYQTGMASSIRCGVRAASARSSGVAICPGDLPLLTSAVVKRLRRAFGQQPRRIVQPVCDGRPGHPVFFGRAFWAALGRLSGDGGARAVLQKNEDCVTRVEVGMPGIFLDADTPEALARLRRRWQGDATPPCATAHPEHSA